MGSLWTDAGPGRRRERLEPGIDREIRAPDESRPESACRVHLSEGAVRRMAVRERQREPDPDLPGVFEGARQFRCEEPCCGERRLGVAVRAWTPFRRLGKYGNRGVDGDGDHRFRHGPTSELKSA